MPPWCAVKACTKHQESPESLGLLRRFGFDLVWSALFVLKRGYHPRNHLICTNAQTMLRGASITSRR